MRLTKHHGLGNDFLVVVDPERQWPLDARLARALCDRRLGVGADGIIRATPLAGAESGAQVRMELRNADGRPAEMSGNGLRCMAQAVTMASLVSEADFVVETDAGRRSVRVEPASAGGVVVVTLGMGVPRVLEECCWTDPTSTSAEAGRWEGRAVSMGNPHVVLWVESTEELASLPLHRIGPAIEAATGSNVEWIAAAPEGGLSLRVWERGVGITRACGTGSVAAAAAARMWGRAGQAVTVRNPGGPLEVDLGPIGTEATLSGPSAYVAAVEIDPSALLAQHAAGVRSASAPAAEPASPGVSEPDRGSAFPGASAARWETAPEESAPPEEAAPLGQAAPQGGAEHTRKATA